MVPAAGVLLVATPQLTDPSFLHAVVYLLDHGDQGTLGFIINRPLAAELRDIWNEVPSCLATCKAAAEGGPVERTKGLLLHGSLDLRGAQAMASGVAVGGDPEALAVRYQKGCNASGPRLFLGHSGWTPGQLDHELKEGAWLVRPGRKEMLLDINPSQDLWRSLIEGRSRSLPPPSVN
jgi:putative transcriptional regulator